MKSALKELYDRFYIRHEWMRCWGEVERCHQELIHRLGEDERKMVLRIIDSKDF